MGCGNLVIKALLCLKRYRAKKAQEGCCDEPGFGRRRISGMLVTKPWRGG
jgi:hypothetical protein